MSALETLSYIHPYPGFLKTETNDIGYPRLFYARIGKHSGTILFPLTVQGLRNMLVTALYLNLLDCVAEYLSSAPFLQLNVLI